MEAYFKAKIRNVPDFPKKGIMFRDITTLLKDKEAFKRTANQLYELSRKMHVDKVVGIESRGFIFGSILADRMDAGLILARKPGKLPASSLKQTYMLEYGEDSLEIHKDAISPGDRVLIHDDLLATGGTAKAVCELVEKAGGKVVQLTFVVELTFLNGREKFQDYPVESLVKYHSE